MGSSNFKKNSGFTLIELIITIAILIILLTIIINISSKTLNNSKVFRSVVEIKQIQQIINSYDDEYRSLPPELKDAYKVLNDPWGNPYQYLNFSLVDQSKWRKDKFLHPLNSTYDLWSMGRDGQSRIQLNSEYSKDDIIRGNDGEFIGLASDY